MRVDPVWAAQYVYLDGFWRGRERVVYDPVLAELLLEHAGESLSWDEDGRVHDMLEELLASDAGAVWLLFDDIAAVSRSGIDTHVLGARGLEEGPWLVRRRPWEVALIDIGELRHVQPGARRPPGRAGALSEVLAELRTNRTDERCVIVWARSQEAFGAQGMTYATFCAWAKSFFPDGKTIGLATTASAQAFALGPLTRTRASERALASDEVSIEMDNRLGSDHPRFAYYLAIAGARTNDTMTLLELPAGALDRSPSELALRIEGQEGESQLEAHLAALQGEVAAAQERKMELLRELDHATQRIAELEDELDDLRDPPGLSDAEPDTPELRPDDPAAKAMVLQAAWELEQLRAQVAALRARPVEDLEAENAKLRAELAALKAQVLVPTSVDAKSDIPDLAVGASAPSASSPLNQDVDDAWSQTWRRRLTATKPPARPTPSALQAQATAHVDGAEREDGDHYKAASTDRAEDLSVLGRLLQRSNDHEPEGSEDHGEHAWTDDEPLEVKDDMQSVEPLLPTDPIEPADPQVNTTDALQGDPSAEDQKSRPADGDDRNTSAASPLSHDPTAGDLVDPRQEEGPQANGAQSAIELAWSRRNERPADATRTGDSRTWHVVRHEVERLTQHFRRGKLPVLELDRRLNRLLVLLRARP